MNTQLWDMKSLILKGIKNKGGWVNAHTHLDRAYTIRKHTLPLASEPLQKKWELVDEIKRTSTVHKIYDRMSYAVEEQIKQGVTVIGSFIDVDSVIKDKAMIAADKVRNSFKHDVTIKYVNQTLKGVLRKDARFWFFEAVHFVDIIGGLPKKDLGREEEHLDVLFSTARKMGKMLHIHVDQNNDPKEHEVRQIVRKTKEYSLQGRVVAIHGVSLAAHSKQYRYKVYDKMKKENVMLITCPTAWIDARRNEVKTVTHNAIAPIEELVSQDICVALGTDNIADIYKPFTDGNMWTELRFLLESCHFYDILTLQNIATLHGKKVLGV